MKSTILKIVFIILLCSSHSFAQTYSSRNGYEVPPRGTVKVLYIFAELTGNCGTGGNWPAGQLPSDANAYMDHTVVTNPTSTISKYYKSQTLNTYNVIGDYYNGIVQVPCGSSNADVIAKLNTIWQPNASGQYMTANNQTLTSFDTYVSGEGILKTQGSGDGKIDVTIILWRNNPGFACDAGLGVANHLGPVTLKNKSVDLYGAWGHCENSYNFFFAEYFHAIMGGNNYHTTAGAGNHTFWTFTGTFAMSSQAYSPSFTSCGWDRYFLGIKGSRNFYISALNTSNVEVASDISITSAPNESTFILRDFITVGDAVRIKLPLINWSANGDKKNQYLWLENHQKINQFDVNVPACAQWAKGLYAYLQVGKDVLTSNTTANDIYAENNAGDPNALASYLFPVSAEGNFDFYYEYSSQNSTQVTCQWGNKSLPYSKLYPNGEIKANPFTGFSDLYGIVNTNGDDYINANDDLFPKYQKYSSTPNGDPPAPTIPAFGDNLDAFTTVGKILNIASNPAPVPVYTLQSYNGGTINNFENRTIYLNGLSVEILSTDALNNGTGAIKIKIKWDDYAIDRDTRWCGYVVLKDNSAVDPNHRISNVVVQGGKKVTLDKGLSPTQNFKSTFPDGSFNFTEPTVLTLEQNTKLTINDLGQFNIVNGSTLLVKDGSTLEIQGTGKITTDATSRICIDQGAILNITNNDVGGIVANVNGTILTYKGSVNPTMSGNIPSQFLSENNVYTTIVSTGPGLINASGVYSKGFKALKSINLNPGFELNAANSASSFFDARIQPPLQSCFNIFAPTNTSWPTTYVTNPVIGGKPHSHDVTEMSWVHIDYAHEDHDHSGHDHDDVTSTLTDDELASDMFFKVIPNPSTGVFTLISMNKEIVDHIKIVNSSGMEILNKSGVGAIDQMPLNFSELPNGIYFLIVYTNAEVVTKKIIIEK